VDQAEKEVHWKRVPEEIANVRSVDIQSLISPENLVLRRNVLDVGLR
jgi:hypothetical protein